MRILKPARYVIPGNPIPLQRARVGRGMRPWDPQKAEKKQWIEFLEDQHGDRPMYSGPVWIDIQFFFQVPLTHMHRAEYLVNTPHIYRPDIDNLEKFVLDCAQGIIFKDDCIVSRISSMKSYAIEPCTLFVITPMKPTEKFIVEEIWNI